MLLYLPYLAIIKVSAYFFSTLQPCQPLCLTQHYSQDDIITLKNAIKGPLSQSACLLNLHHRCG